MTDDLQEVRTEEPDLAEGYPSLNDVMRGILAADEVPDIGVRRVEVNCFASGEATYRCWIVGRDDPEGGYLSQL